MHVGTGALRSDSNKNKRRGTRGCLSPGDMRMVWNGQIQSIRLSAA